MDKLITTVNEYFWTSFWVFLGLYILLSIIATVVENIFFSKFKNKN